MADSNTKIARPGTVDYEVMTRTDPALLAYLRAMSPEARGVLRRAATGLYRQRVQAHLDKYKLVYEGAHSITATSNHFVEEREFTPAEWEQEINKRVAKKIEFYQRAGKEAARGASKEPYNNEKFAAWDIAREEYRKVNMKGGDPSLDYTAQTEIQILRDAEHYLFRYWITSAQRIVTIPHGIPLNIDKSINPTLPMNWVVIGLIHDPIYNFVRHTILEKITNISPTTPEMNYWEEKGFQDGMHSEREAPSCARTDSCPNYSMGHR
jgi:hypothetical protein